MLSRQITVSVYKGLHLISFDDLEPDPVEAARAWFQVRGYESAVSGLCGERAAVVRFGDDLGGGVGADGAHAG